MGKRKQTGSAERVWWTEHTKLPIDELLGYISDEDQRESVKTKLRNNKKLRVSNISAVIKFGKFKGKTVLEVLEDPKDEGEEYMKYMMKLPVKDKETGEETGEIWLEKYHKDVFNEVSKLLEI